MKFIYLILVFALASCINGPANRNEPVLARVYDDYLYGSELRNIIPEGTAVKDSIALVQNYVNNWIQQKLLLHKAEKNLLEKDKNFDKQLEEYRNSLVIYQFESKLISQDLDTVVSDVEIEAYYNDNIENFQLKDNIVKSYYAKFEADYPSLRKVKNFFRSNAPFARDSLEVYIERDSKLFFLEDESWILFDDLLRFVPIETYNQEAYLGNNRKIELKVEDDIYLVCFTDFRIKEGVSPLSFEKENIRQIIINKRKLNIKKQLREDVLQTGDYEIY